MVENPDAAWLRGIVDRIGKAGTYTLSAETLDKLADRLRDLECEVIELRESNARLRKGW